MTDAEIEAHNAASMAVLPESVKLHALDILREELPEDVLEQVCAEHAAQGSMWFAPYHFFWGMGVRNLLRQRGLTDDLLPGETTWDDYYVPLVEIVAGIREDS